MPGSDEPDLDEDYQISVKLPEDVADEDDRPHHHVQHYLDRLADAINASDHVHVQHDDGVGIRLDESGAAWQDATMSIYYSVGCGPKRGDYGDGDGDDDDDRDGDPEVGGDGGDVKG
jgi:hypothetical protein